MTHSNRRPAEIAKRSAQALERRTGVRDAFRRETFALPREAARAKAREFFRRFPKAAYMTEMSANPSINAARPAAARGTCATARQSALGSRRMVNSIRSPGSSRHDSISVM